MDQVHSKSTPKQLQRISKVPLTFGLSTKRVFSTGNEQLGWKTDIFVKMYCKLIKSLSFFDLVKKEKKKHKSVYHYQSKSAHLDGTARCLEPHSLLLSIITKGCSEHVMHAVCMCVLYIYNIAKA
jgi:hypothetical protein